MIEPLPGVLGKLLLQASFWHSPRAVLLHLGVVFLVTSVRSYCNRPLDQAGVRRRLGKYSFLSCWSLCNDIPCFSSLLLDTPCSPDKVVCVEFFM